MFQEQLEALKVELDQRSSNSGVATPIDATMEDRQRYINAIKIKMASSLLLEILKELKPQERGELSRRFAIAITDTEKLLAYLHFLYISTEE